MATKYIVFEDLTFVVFPDFMTHASVAMNFRVKPETAGFVSLDTLSEVQPLFRAYGESVSLRLKSDPERDTKLLSRLLRN